MKVDYTLFDSLDWHERGFTVLNGLAVESEAEAKAAVASVSASLGTLLGQDATGVKVRAVRDRGVAIGDGPVSRYSDSHEGGNLHTDGPHRPGTPPDAFALLCVRQAAQGGELLLVQGKDIIGALTPAVRQILRRPYHFDQRQAGSTPVVRPILERSADGSWRFAYLRTYIELGHRHPGVERLDDQSIQALDDLDAALDRASSDSRLHDRLKLEPGQLALVDNRRLLHGRTAFHDRADTEGRLLLRTWIRLTDN